MPLVPGDRLGPYKVESLLGTGGMGEVYRAVDSRLGRAVAIKVISRRLVGDEASRRRFETEARAASALNHPSIITIYDIGESEGMSWIAMELIEGRTLGDVIAPGPLPIRRAWSIARQLADGLAAAHAKGIVHRDLKPANVMVTDDDRVKILDFGLARQHVATPPDAATVTALNPGSVAGEILGTVGYMSPEQATSRPVDFRADQFSFGAVVYELLAGRRAFAGSSTVETLSAIIRDDPTPVSSIRGDVSETFQRVIDKCLEKEPARRFESTRELAAALEVLTPESSSAAGVKAQAIESRPAARAKGWLPGAWLVGAAAVLVTAVIAGAYFWNRPTPQPALPAIDSVAVIPFENTAQDPEIDYLGDGLTDSLIDHLTRISSLRVMARATVARFKGQPNPQQIAKALGVGSVVIGALSRRGNQITISAELIHGATGERLWGQTFDRPMAELMQVQGSIVLSIAEGLRLRLSGDEKARLGGFGTDNPEAYELFLKGRYLMQEESEETDLEARELFEQAVAKDPRFLEAHLAISSVWSRSAGGGYSSPKDAVAHADAALAKAEAIDPNNVAVRVARMNRQFATTRDWAAAEREFRSVMNDPVVLRNVQYHPISLFFVAIGRPDEAVAIVEHALAVDPGNLESRVMLGNFQVQAGRLDDALRTYETIAAEVPDDARPMFGVADVYKRRGQYSRASEALKKAYELSADPDAARAFAHVTTEAEYTKAEQTVARADLKNLELEAAHRYVPPLDVARLNAVIGNREKALSGLEQAVDAGVIGAEFTGLSLLKVDQAWNSVRADPRFAAVIRKIGIP